VVIVPVILIVLMVGLTISLMQGESDRADIDRWAAGQGYQIEEIEKTWFDNGPYWVKGRGTRIYRCRVSDREGKSRTVYMRTRFFGNDYEFYDP
jgi:hypothetical protein